MQKEKVIGMQIKYKFDSVTLKKIGKSAGLLLLGAVATVLQEQVPNIDFGSWSPVALAVNTWVINTIGEFIKGQDVKDNSETNQ